MKWVFLLYFQSLRTLKISHCHFTCFNAELLFSLSFICCSFVWWWSFHSLLLLFLYSEKVGIINQQIIYVRRTHKNILIFQIKLIISLADIFMCVVALFTHSPWPNENNSDSHSGSNELVSLSCQCYYLRSLCKCCVFMTRNSRDCEILYFEVYFWICFLVWANV